LFRDDTRNISLKSLKRRQPEERREIPDQVGNIA